MGLESHHEEGAEDLSSREPDFDDIARIAAELNRLGAKYVVVGGFAVIRHGYPRFTSDIDLLIDCTPDNERLVLEALRILPDQASRLIEPGAVEKYVVVRIGDEVTVDLMKSGCGVDYAAAILDARVLEVNGVPIPFASPKTLRRMKQTVREKDIPDRIFLRQKLAEEGTPVADETPDPIGWLDRLMRWLSGKSGRR